MLNKNVLWAKISALERHLDRIRIKRGVTLEEFLKDIDRQESLLFNLQMAIQNCLDMAAHIVSEKELGLAGSSSELFYLMEDQNIIGQALTEKMIQAVGFRNLVVHAYGKLNLEVVFEVSHQNISDLEEFGRLIRDRFG